METGEGDSQRWWIILHLDKDVDEYQLAQDEEVIKSSTHAHQKRNQANEQSKDSTPSE